MSRQPHFAMPATAIAAALTMGLTGCSADPAAPGAPGSTTPATTTVPAVLKVTDAWAQANPSLNPPTASVFARIHNPTSRPVRITGATSSQAPRVELHHTASRRTARAMQQADGGLVVEPGAVRDLAPGGDHVMLMSMDQALPVGHTVTITLATDSGQTVVFEAVAKTFSGGAQPSPTGASASGSAPTTSSSPRSEPGTAARTDAIRTPGS